MSPVYKHAKSLIESVHYLNVGEAIDATQSEVETSTHSYLATLAIVTLKNGMVCIGKSQCHDPRTFDQQLGEQGALQNAMVEISVLASFDLRSEPVKVEAVSDAPSVEPSIREKIRQQARQNVLRQKADIDPYILNDAIDTFFNDEAIDKLYSTGDISAEFSAMQQSTLALDNFFVKHAKRVGESKPLKGAPGNVAWVDESPFITPEKRQDVGGIAIGERVRFNYVNFNKAVGGSLIHYTKLDMFLKKVQSILSNCELTIGMDKKKFIHFDFMNYNISQTVNSNVWTCLLDLTYAGILCRQSGLNKSLSQIKQVFSKELQLTKEQVDILDGALTMAEQGESKSTDAIREKIIKDIKQHYTSYSIGNGEHKELEKMVMEYAVSDDDAVQALDDNASNIWELIGRIYFSHSLKPKSETVDQDGVKQPQVSTTPFTMIDLHPCHLDTEERIEILDVFGTSFRFEFTEAPDAKEKDKWKGFFYDQLMLAVPHKKFKLHPLSKPPVIRVDPTKSSADQANNLITNLAKLGVIYPDYNLTDVVGRNIYLTGPWVVKLSESTMDRLIDELGVVIELYHIEFGKRMIHVKIDQFEGEITASGDATIDFRDLVTEILSTLKEAGCIGYKDTPMKTRFLKDHTIFTPSLVKSIFK